MSAEDKGFEGFCKLLQKIRKFEPILMLRNHWLRRMSARYIENNNII